MKVSVPTIFRHGKKYFWAKISNVDCGMQFHGMGLRFEHCRVFVEIEVTNFREVGFQTHPSVKVVSLNRVQLITESECS